MQSVSQMRPSLKLLIKWKRDCDKTKNFIIHTNDYDARSVENPPYFLSISFTDITKFALHRHTKPITMNESRAESVAANVQIMEKRPKRTIEEEDENGKNEPKYMPNASECVNFQFCSYLMFTWILSCSVLIPSSARFVVQCISIFSFTGGRIANVFLTVSSTCKR